MPSLLESLAVGPLGLPTLLGGEKQLALQEREVRDQTLFETQFQDILSGDPLIQRLINAIGQQPLNLGQLREQGTRDINVSAQSRGLQAADQIAALGLGQNQFAFADRLIDQSRGLQLQSLNQLIDQAGIIQRPQQALANVGQQAQNVLGLQSLRVAGFS